MDTEMKTLGKYGWRVQGQRIHKDPYLTLWYDDKIIYEGLTEWDRVDTLVIEFIYGMEYELRVGRDACKDIEGIM